MADVQLLNCFEVPQGQEEKFLALWREVNAYMVTKPGYINHHLHRSLAPDARFRFINYAEWQTPELFRAAHDERFRGLVAGPEWSDFSSLPALYEILHSGERG